MRRRLAIALVVLSGCFDDERFPPTDEIISVVACPSPDVPCGTAADGATLRAYRFCTAAEAPRVSPLTLTATASAGSWVGASSAASGTFTADLAATGCADALFLPGTTPGAVRIDARLVNVQQTSDFVLGAAEIGAVDLKADPLPLAAPGTATLTLTAKVRGVGQGRPSQGTLVSFSLGSVTPAGAFATIVPTSEGQPISGTDDATAQLVLSGVTSIEVRATATPPVVKGAPEPLPGAKSVEMTIAVP